MPVTKINGALIHYEIHGAGSETILFAHGLLWSGRIFEKQIEALKDQFRCVTFDFRGQGETEVTRSGYDIETLYTDTVGLIETLGAAPCHFVGLSMGGIVGLRIAIRRPELVKSLALLATSADAETNEKKRRYRLLTIIARLFGLRIIANRVMPIMFGNTFLNDPARSGQKLQWRANFTANHRLGASRAVIGVSTREAIYDQINKITVPTLVVIGDEDAAIPRERATRIHSQISGSKLVVLPRAGHTPSVEEPEAVNELLKTFLQNIGSAVEIK